MPTLARFYGIIIRMYFKQVDHSPSKELLRMWETQEFHEVEPLK